LAKCQPINTIRLTTKSAKIQRASPGLGPLQLAYSPCSPFDCFCSTAGLLNQCLVAVQGQGGLALLELLAGSPASAMPALRDAVAADARACFEGLQMPGLGCNASHQESPALRHGEETDNRDVVTTLSGATVAVATAALRPRVLALHPRTAADATQEVELAALDCNRAWGGYRCPSLWAPRVRVPSDVRKGLLATWGLRPLVPGVPSASALHTLEVVVACSQFPMVLEEGGLLALHNSEAVVLAPFPKPTRPSRSAPD